MDSPTACSRYIPQNSKKRVFVSGSSSSGCKDVEVLEISPPATGRSSKPKPSIQKEVICHEIIDVDMEEDCDDVSLTDSKLDRSGKGKKVLSSSSVGVSSLANEKSGNDTLTSSDGAAGSTISTNMDDFGSDLHYGEDDWLESYYEDIISDDQPTLESHFDKMDIPPGVEASFPWLPGSPKDDTKVLTASSSLQLEGISVLPGLNSASQNSSSQNAFISDSTSWSNSTASIQIGNQDTKGKKRSSASNSTLSLVPNTLLTSLAQNYGKESWQSSGKSQKKPSVPHSMYSSPYHPFPFGPTYPSNYPNPVMPPNLFVAGHTMPMWQDLPMNMLDPGHVNGSSFSSWDPNLGNDVNNTSSLPTKAWKLNMDDVKQKFNNFKKFDTVEDHSDHHFSRNTSVGQPPKNWAKKIQEEWEFLESGLPDTIFVRVYESRMDLLRAVIIGAEGTPYHDGLFFFDVFFPSAYPKVAPLVHYHSGGLRINPNLYHCGKLCLSLIDTWDGPPKEKWVPGRSTVLQVLVSIQGLVLNAKPYFNEPGYDSTSGTPDGEKKSFEYNERTFMYSLKTMVYSMRRPPKHFEEFVYGHYCKCARDILVSCKAYLDGAQVGCLVRGGVQDVDEGDKSCSQHFRNNLAAFITTLVNTFLEIGAKDCQEFLTLANKGTRPPTPLAHNLFY